MDETQLLEGCSLEKRESDKDDAKERGEPLAKLKVFKNDYFPEAELPLYLGNNVLGRDSTSCSVVLSAPSVSKRHAVISLSVFPGDKFCSGPVTEALLWDLGSLNGTRKCRFRLTPNVRYALSEGEYVVLADVPCQYIVVGEVTPSDEKDAAVVAGGLRGRGKLRGRGRRRGTERKGQGKGRSDGEKDANAQDRAQEEQQRSEHTTPNPARTTGLSLEQTPAQPKKLLELASESDTDDDSKGRRDKRQQVFATDSDSSQLTGPTCSTFLSPTNNVVPESEDESPITPTVKNVRTGQTQSSGKTEEKNPAGSKRIHMLMGDGDSEVQESLIHIIEKTANENDRNLEENAVNGHQCGNIKTEGGSQTNNCGSSLTTNVPALGHDAGPAVEDKGQEERNTSQHEPVQDDHCKSTVDMPAFHMDSDTDIEEDKEVGDVSGTVSDVAATSVAPSTSTDVTAAKVLVTQPDDIHLDSDTDVEDNEGSSSTTTHVLNSSAKGVSAPQVIAAEFHLDSDTDSEGVTECPTKSNPVADSKSIPFTALPLKPQELNLGSDTDIEDMDDHPLVKSQSSPLAVPEGHRDAAKQQLGLEIQYDSDSEAEEDSTQMFTPLANAKLETLARTEPQLASSVAASVTVAPRSSPSADRIVEKQGSAKPYPEMLHLPKNAGDPLNCNLESDTDVEDEDDQVVQGVQEANVTPRIPREQNCSTPLNSDSALPSLLNPKHFTDDQDEDKDDDFVVAETQAFLSNAPAGSRHETYPVLDATQLYVQESPQAVETSAGEAVEEQATQTFQMDLSDSSHNQSMSTRVSHTLAPMEEEEEEEKEVEDLEAIQIHRDAPPSERTGFVETDGDLEPTQAYGGLPVLVLNSPARVDVEQLEGGTELEFHSGDPQQMKDKEEGEDTQPVHFHADSHLSTADTQPVSAFETRDRGLRFEEEVVQEGVAKPLPQNLRREAKEIEEDVQPSGSNSRGRRGEEEEGERKRIQSVKRVTRRSSKAESKQEHTRRGKEPEEDIRSNKEEDEVCQDQCNLTEKRKRRRNTINLIQEKENNGSETESVEGLERDKAEREMDEKQEKRLDNERKKREEKGRKQNVERENETMERPAQTEQEVGSLETENKEQEVLQRQEREEKERGQKQSKERQEKEQVDEAKKERERLEREGEKQEGSKRLEREENPRKDGGGETSKEGKVRQENEKLEKEMKEDKRLKPENKQEENQKLEQGKDKEGLAKHKEKEEKQETGRMLDSEKQKRGDEGGSEETVKQESEKRLKSSSQGRRKTRNAAPSTTAVKETTGSGEEMVAIELEPKTDGSSSIASAGSTICNSSTGMQKRGRAKKSQGRSELDPDKVNVSADRKQSARGSRSQTVTDSEPMTAKTEMIVVQDEKAAQHSKPSTSRGVNKGHKGCAPVIAAVVDPANTSVLVQRRSRGGNKSEKLIDLESTASEPDQTAVTFKGQHNEVQGSKLTGRLRCRKRGLEKDTEEKEEDTPSKMVRARRMSQKPGKMGGEKAEETETTEESEREKCQPCTSLRKGRTSIAKKVQPEVEPRDETKEEETSVLTVQRKVRERHRANRKKNESEEKNVLVEEQNEETALGTSSEDLVKNCEKTEIPQTPPTRNSRKRTSANESPATPKMSRRSPGHAVSTLGTVDRNAYKVLFTGLTDEQGEMTVLRLGGSMAKGVSDMTHLVTDKVRRTVKFLCAVARGVPVVTTAWLEKCGKSGTFLSPSAFLVKDVEQEKKFNFCLEESLRVANAQPLLQGYEIHVTRSVKPEPAQMKDIISCSGARYIPKMPTVQKPKTVVISCEEDASLCGPALSASLPVLSAEFLLSGILQQKVDLVAHSLTGPCFEAKSAPRERNRK